MVKLIGVDPPVLYLTYLEVILSFGLWVEFSDGTQKAVDLRPFLDSLPPGTVFEPLRDPAAFARAILWDDSVYWEAENADLAPEFLHDLPHRPDLEAEVIARWGREEAEDQLEQHPQACKGKAIRHYSGRQSGSHLGTNARQV